MAKGTKIEGIAERTNRKPSNQRYTHGRPRLQQMAREGLLIIDTPDGIVNVGNTASVWGEGENVDGFRWAVGGEVKGRERLDATETDRLFGAGYYEMVAEWAHDQPPERPSAYR